MKESAADRPPQLPRSAKPLRADAQNNRVRIVNAARARFAAEGLAAEMDVIAADAGGAVGTLYRHFAKKDDLLEEVLRAGFARATDFLQTLLQEADPWIAFERLLRHLAELQVSDQGFKDLLAANPALRTSAVSLKRELGPLFAKIISRAQASGRLREDLVASDLPLLLRGLPTGPRDGAARERYVDILLRGLRRPSTSRARTSRKPPG
jgi:AcrR family transcriptional regulator